jgi:hypothetical protein
MAKGRKKKKSRSPILVVILLFVIALLSLKIWMMSETLKESKEDLRKMSMKARSSKPSQTTSQVIKPEVKLSERQQIALKNIVGNPDFSKLISQKPTFGGRWSIWSDENVTFIDDRTALIVYEDGHVMGAMIVKIPDPNDIGRWKVLWNGII